MPILKIARMGHPILNQISQPVIDPTAPEVSRLISAMIETMEDAKGTGLAAPQVHMPWRIVVYKVIAEREDTGENGGVPTTAIINPVIKPLCDDTNVAFEACLSVPGMAGPVSRFNRIGLTYQNIIGETVECEAEGFHARVLQHECDHLDGVLYPMRIEDMSQFGFIEEMGKNNENEGSEQHREEVSDE